MYQGSEKKLRLEQRNIRKNMSDPKRLERLIKPPHPVFKGGFEAGGEAARLKTS
jgi:hypothetical protein